MSDFWNAYGSQILPALLQHLFLVGLSLVLGIIVAGIRLAAIYLVSWATIAALIGAGGLGDLIFSGLDSEDANLLMAGAIPTALLALILGFGFGQIRRLVTPRGLRAEAGAAVV